MNAPVSAYVDRACASPHLPAAILPDGRRVANAPPLPVIAVGAPKRTLRLALARTTDEEERGLMCVRKLAPGAGMLFVFADDGMREFWMKDTIAPLDMLFVDASGRVISVAADVPATTLATPSERIPRRSGVGRYVVELAAGAAAHAGIAAGTRLALPGFLARP